MKYFLIITLIALSSCTNGGENEIFIVPRYYSGAVIIIYDQSNGNPAKYYQGKRLYEIPSNGILKTQFKTNDDWRKFPDFYYEKVAPGNKIDFIPNSEEILVKDTVASGGISGSANIDLAGKKTANFMIYYIGTKDQIDTAYEEAEKIDITKLVD